MKRLISMTLTLLLLVGVLSGCGNEGGQSSGSATPAATPAGTGEPSSTPSSPEKTPLQIGFVICGGKLGDQATNDSSYAGLEKFCADTGATLKYVELSELQDIEPAIRNYADQGVNLIISNSADPSEFIPDIAPDYPDIKFIINEGTVEGCDNVLNTRTSVADASFLCGAFAALMSESLGGAKEAGFIGGVRNPNLERAQYGFTAGAEYVGGKSTVAYVGNFTDAAAAKELAHQMFGGGLRIVQAWSGGANTGIFEAAANQGEGYYTLGGATGQFHMSDSIIASNVKNLDVLMYDLCEQAMNGTLPSGTQTYDITAGAVGIKYPTDARVDLVPQDIKDQIAQLQEKIVSGEITCPSTEAEYKTFLETLPKT